MLGFHQNFCVSNAGDSLTKCITLLICLFSKWFFTVFSCNTLGIMKFHLLFLTSSKKKRDGREPSPLNKLYQIQRQVSCALSGKSVLVCLLLLRETAHSLVCTGREARPYWLPTHPDTRPQHLHHHRSDKHTHTDADTQTHRHTPTLTDKDT